MATSRTRAHDDVATPDTLADATVASHPAASVDALLLSGGHVPDGGCIEAAEQNLLARLALAPVRERAIVLARLQNGIGNARVARRLAPATSVVVAREEPEMPPEFDPGLESSEPTELQAPPGQGSGTPTAAPAAPAPFPPVTPLTRNCDDCNAAVDILKSGAYLGEADVQLQWEGVGEIQVTKTKKGYVASTGVSWKIDVTTSKMEVTDFVWPNMTDADKSAVAAYKAALQAHEEEHFTRVAAALKTLPTTWSASAKTKQAAVDALKEKLPQEEAKGKAAMQKITDDYDAKTKHGKTQSAVGGTNVHLTCPPPPPPPAAPPAPAP